jgi:hypothetical protein
VRLSAPPGRRISAARLAASHRTAATTSMLTELKEAADALIRRERVGPGHQRQDVPNRLEAATIAHRLSPGEEQ